MYEFMDARTASTFARMAREDRIREVAQHQRFVTARRTARQEEAARPRRARRVVWFKRCFATVG